MTTTPIDRSPGPGSPVVARRMTAAIQNVTADLSALAARPQGLMRLWRWTVRDLSVAVRVLHEQAMAIGVPDNWVEHAHQAGRLGHRTTADGPLPAANTVARPVPLAQLRHQAETLFTLAAIGVVRRDQTTLNTATTHRLSEHIRLQWLRVAMVATAINVTETEVHGWWATDPAAWQPHMTRLNTQVEPERGRYWRELTGTTTLREARARVEAMRMVGLTITDSPPHQLPPAPHLLEASAEHAWQARDQIVWPASELIGTAIEANGVATARSDRIDHRAQDLSPPTRSANPTPEIDL